MDVNYLEQLIFKISNEDLDSLEELYDETRLDVFKYALSILKNRTDAEDVMQDTYININKYAHLYNPRNKPLAWIMTITKNLCLNKIKKNSKSSSVDINDYDNHLKEKDKGYDTVLLKTILDDLTAEERQIFMLSTIDDFKFKEIANLMNLKLSTVLSKYHRTIKKVREKYKDGGK